MNGLSNLITGLAERFTTEEQVSAVSKETNLISLSQVLCVNCSWQAFWKKQVKT